MAKLHEWEEIVQDVGKMSTKQELAYETQYGISLRNTTITAQQAAVAEATQSVR